MSYTITMTLGPTSAQSRVLIDGVDITHCLREVKVQQRVGAPPFLILECAPGGHLEVNAVLDRTNLVVVSMAVDNTRLGEEYRTSFALPGERRSTKESA